MSSILLLVSLIAGRVDANPETTFVLPSTVTMEMVWIKPGTFMMGTTEEQEHLLRSRGMWQDYFETEQPDHSVTITQGFWLGKYEITEIQWHSIMGARSWTRKEHVLTNPHKPATYQRSSE